MVMVPVEPSREMIEAGERAAWDGDNSMPAISAMRKAWSAMIAATQPVPISGEGWQDEMMEAGAGLLKAYRVLIDRIADDEFDMAAGHPASWASKMEAVIAKYAPPVPSVSGEGGR